MYSHNSQRWDLNPPRTVYECGSQFLPNLKLKPAYFSPNDLQFFTTRSQTKRILTQIREEFNDVTEWLIVNVSLQVFKWWELKGVEFLVLDQRNITSFSMAQRTRIG